MYHSCAQWYAHTSEQFLNLCLLHLDFILCICLGLSFYVFSVLARSFYSCIACFCCVGFSFFSPKPRQEQRFQNDLFCIEWNKTLTKSVWGHLKADCRLRYALGVWHCVASVCLMHVVAVRPVWWWWIYETSCAESARWDSTQTLEWLARRHSRTTPQLTETVTGHFIQHWTHFI